MDIATLRAQIARIQLPPGDHPNDEHTLKAFLVPQNGWYCVAHYLLPHDAAYAINAVSLRDLWSQDPDDLLLNVNAYVAGLWKAQPRIAA